LACYLAHYKADTLLSHIVYIFVFGSVGGVCPSCLCMNIQFIFRKGD